MNFLMNFEPFFFQMTACVSAGVPFTLDLWLVTIRINVEISTGLDLNGPPFAGVVHVDFWVFGFGIKFVASAKPQSSIALNRFFAIAAKTGSSSGASSGTFLTGGGDAKPPAKPQPDTAAILLTCQTGLLPPLVRQWRQLLSDGFAPNPSHLGKAYREANSEDREGIGARRDQIRRLQGPRQVQASICQAHAAPQSS